MKYSVRIEIEVISTDFALIEVEAGNEEQARTIAAEVDLDIDDIDRWTSDYLESRLDLDYQSDWEVTEVKDD